MRNKLIDLINDCRSMEGYGMDLVERQADHLLANGVTIQKWIPVSERLPDLGEKVVARGRHLDKYRVVWLQQDEHLDHPYWSYDGDHGYYVEYFEYWMPLPEPPKGANDDEIR